MTLCCYCQKGTQKIPKIGHLPNGGGLEWSDWMGRMSQPPFLVQGLSDMSKEHQTRVLKKSKFVKYLTGWSKF